MKYRICTTNYSDVPRSLQSRVSTIQSVVVTADVSQLHTKFTKEIFLFLGCIDFLERSITRSASRRTHIPLCCGVWFMSSAWSFALASSCCTYLYSFILWLCFIRLHKLFCKFLVYTRSALHYCLEYTPHHRNITGSWRSTPLGSTHIYSYSAFHQAIILNRQAQTYASEFFLLTLD